MKVRARSVLPSAVIAVLLTLALPAAAQQKTAKECNDEWTANKASIQASGKTKKAFVAQCRAGAPADTAGTSQPPPAPAATPGTATTPSAATRAPATGVPAGGGQFATEAQAKGHCPGDTVVWANLDSKIYHFSGTRDYGNTKKGAYMCERETAGAGYRAAKNEKHP
jgi:hypothetical protein